jgi:hypothetical protein
MLYRSKTSLAFHFIVFSNVAFHCSRAGTVPKLFNLPVHCSQAFEELHLDLFEILAHALLATLCA